MWGTHTTYSSESYSHSSPYTHPTFPLQPSLRGSLVLSVLTQMLQSDKGESVREAAVKSLGILVAFTDDINKFKQVCNFE